MTKKKVTFFDEVWKEATKTDKQATKEKIKDRIEDFIMECKAQISNINNSLIPKAQTAQTRAERTIVKAKRMLETVTLGVDKYATFAAYASAINTAEGLVGIAETAKIEAGAAVLTLKAQSKRYEELLARLEK